MARQPAVKLGLVFPVAANTEPHLKFHPFQAVFGLHVSVAYAAVKFSPDMPFMVKLNIVRQIKNPYPLNRRPGIQMLPLL
jgi:hypothetical protein